MIKDIDKKILYYLFHNSRIHKNKLSSEFKISKETISKKISILEKEDYIKSFSLKVNYNLFGFEEINVFIRLSQNNEKIFSEMIEYLINHSNSTWVGKSFGKYDLKVAFLIKDNSQINNIISDLNLKFGKFIKNLDYLLIIDKFKASEDLFLQNLLDIKLDNSFNLNKKDVFNNIIENKEFTPLQIDRELIFHFGQNPNCSYVDLSKKINLTPEGIKYKVKQMENLGVINGYSIVINGNKLNKIWCLVLLNIESKMIEEFKYFLKKQTYLSNYVQTIGIWNFNITFFANNIEDLYKNLNHIRNKFSSEIINFDILLIFDIYKYPKVPKCVLN